MKVYLDEALSPTIAELLRRHGINASTAQEVGNAQLDDRAQLAYATREGRALVTANVVDFIELAHEAVATNTEHAGIVLVPSSFRGDEFPVIDREGLHGLVLYIQARLGQTYERGDRPRGGVARTRWTHRRRLL